MPVSVRFARKPAVVAMVHVAALPGTPAHRLPCQDIVRLAEEEARLCREAGADAVLLENMHDRPYLRSQAGAEITACMTLLGAAVKSAAAPLPCGMQILAAANREALAAAAAAQLDFIRAEGFVFAHVADEGYIESSAADLLRYRRVIDAESVAVYADIKKKHAAHALTADVSLEETARAAEFFLCDGVVITGAVTGSPPSSEEVAAVSRAVSVPVVVGSGVDAGNAQSLARHADALIVGSAIKRDGNWENPIDPFRLEQLIQTLRS
ncbi:MAG TPA: BtpA/SgcQ family protein [Verrucomicrobiales bacterium]|nr:BtpA/SgcQ family protein [Verrucomicrobiales bacterium]